MRLLSITVRNYRVHKELTVRFDPSRNVIGGPNESGKSTLAEAAHRALFLRAKTGGKVQKEMVSAVHLGDPEVLLTFESDGVSWELEKRFSGTKGSTRLTRAGGSPLKDDEAETLLATLLKSETASGGGAAKLLPSLWSHLWVWQGSSGEDPSGHASDHKDTLVQRLQQDGLAAVMQSASDQRVREKIATVYETLFTATGKPRAGSEPELARVRLEEAAAALRRAQENAARLEQAASDHGRAEMEMAEADAVLPSLKAQRTATDNRLAEVDKLRREEDLQRHAAEVAASIHKQAQDNDAEIRKLEEQIKGAAEALAPAQRLEEGFANEEKTARELSQAGELSQRSAADAVRDMRLRHDLAAACISSFEKSAEHHRLVEMSKIADSIRAALEEKRDELAKLPILTAKDLETLRKLERTASQATASLNAMAASIELIATDQSVVLNGSSLSAGESTILTDLGELAIGLGTRLRIRPGGGTSLSEARELEETSLRAFNVALEKLTVRDLDHATTVLQQRQTISQQIEKEEVRWKALGGATLAAELEKAMDASKASKAEIQRRMEALGAEVEIIMPESLETARQWRAGLQQALASSEQTEISTRQQSAQLRQRFETAIEKLRCHREQTAQASQALRTLEMRLQVLKETHGEASAREQSIESAKESATQTAAVLANTRKSLTALAPDLLEADLERFTRAITQQETRRREAEILRSVARDRLTLDGSTDPHAELSHAQARQNAALETFTSQQRYAKAIEKLHHLFSESREAIDRALIQPLAERISGYLQCLFGPGAQVEINLSDNGIEGLNIIRADNSNFNFATLSGGAKEQVAAAVRLAMAEILAADHNGSLPIVFDDAFAFTDPGRVQSLQRMLNLAAMRGLQLIVLTCTPNDYSAFGAVEVRL